MMTMQELTKKWGIGLTGSIATGKSTIGTMLQDLGYLVIDSDKLSREVVAPGTKVLAKIVECFGGCILTQKGELNRKKMRQIIVDDPEKKKQLEKITHPAIEQQLKSTLQHARYFEEPKIFIYEAALIIETGNYTKFRSIWLANCDEQTQIQRLMQRDRMTREEAQAMIKSQMPNNQKIAIADVVFDTNKQKSDIAIKLKHELEKISYIL